MNKQTVLICLERLDIGGVETAVINQTIALIKKGINVVILAKEGIYKQKIVEIGAKFINWNFNIKNNISYEKIKNVIEIMHENEVSHVIVNQFPCINDVVFACLMKKIPYTVYLHTTYKSFENENVNNNVYEYFKNNFKMFKKYFEIMFKYASQIVAITPIAKEYLIKKYNIAENKIIVIPNSIDIESFHAKNKITKISNFLLISRISEEKMESIKEAISFFDFYVRKYKNEKHTLKIIGDGNKKEEILKYINNFKLDDKIEFIGSVSNVKEYIENSDVVLGIDRCLLEAISMKRIAIICGYDGLKGVVNSDNINLCIDENFSGRLLKNVIQEKLASYINNMSKKDINNLVEYNFKVCNEKLDITKNIYFLDNVVKQNYELAIDDIWKIIDFATIMLDFEKDNIEKLKLNIWELNNKYNYIISDKDKIINRKEEIINRKEEIINDKQLEIDKLNIELQSIYSSRSYKAIQKIKKIFNKK